MNLPSRLLVALLLLLASAASSQTLFGPDSSGRRNREFHALHYRLDLAFDHRGKSVRGSVAIRLTPLAGPLDSVVLDAVDMSVSSVRLEGGRPLEFRNLSPVLAIRLDRTYAFGETLAVRIDYSCTPSKGLYFIYADSGEGRHDQIWSQGEDMDNRYWFPCYDYPNDKATSEVIGTVPGDWTLLSNGRLAGETRDAKKNTRTFHWVESKPHSTYLIMVAAGRYAIIRGKYRNIPVDYYMYPEDTAKWATSFSRTPAMMRFMEEKTGVPYPWEKFDQIVIDDFMWGGMENTTAVTLNDACVVGPRAAIDFPSDPVVVHELAHMWFGDLVTTRDWENLWLNEGFATYCENLWTEASQGEDALQYEMIQSSFRIRGDERMLGRRPIVSRDSHPENLYARGGWVLHMLRAVLGDEAFFRGLHYYLAKFQYASAETDEFRLAMEDATGQSLDWFFREWVLRAGLPKLEVSKSWDDSTRTLSLVVRQEQPVDSLTGYFRFPLAVECTTEHGKTARTYWVDGREDTIAIALDGPPLMVIADKGYHVLKEMHFPKSEKENIYQLRHASDVADRITAARSLGDDVKDPAAREALEASAAADPFWAVRESALTTLATIGNDSSAGTFLAALRDPNSRVRSVATRFLSLFKKHDVARLLDSLARSDSSYLVCREALRELAGVDTARAFDAARDLLTLRSYRDVLRLSALSTLRAARSPRAIALALPFTDRANASDVRRIAASVLGEYGKDSLSARDRLRALLRDGDPAIRSAAVSAVGGWKDREFESLLTAMEPGESSPEVQAVLKRTLHPPVPSGEEGDK
ncbi:MAG TPA: M1 family aminopeptidase [Bacteroidota bacterium]|nr:M1 family aminopeptidase [Bacteroidota bacterium]